MPTPLELLADPVSLAVFAVSGALMRWEAAAPARRLPHVRLWRLRGLATFALYFVLSSYLPLLWSERLAGRQLLDLGGLGTVGGALAGVLLYEAGVCAWHRTMHASPTLWRLFHPMHHSAERIDTCGAFWAHPLEMCAWIALFSLGLTLVLGLGAEASTGVILATTFLSMFRHAHVRTPRWLGFLVRRPESHSLHHARGVHGHNDSDLPVFDLLFGSFRNPAAHAGATGFYDGASARVPEMLLARDVSRPSGRRAAAA